HAFGIAAARPLSGAAAAHQRDVASPYDSAARAQGRHEFEVSTTSRVGRDTAYPALDHRVEFEYGVSDRLQGSLYLNLGSESVLDPATGTLLTRSGARGLSNEWKLKFSDPAADPVGFALYAELGL